MLRSRVLTSLVLAAIVVAALLALPPIPLTVILGAMFLGIGGWESTRLAGLDGAFAISAWIAALFGCGALLVWLIHQPGSVPVILAASTAGWLVLAGWLARPEFGRAGAAGFQPAKLLVTGAILLAAFIAIAWLHAGSPWRAIFLILITAAADIGAFFAGHRYGRSKLAPSISPGKTRAGAVGGVLAAAATAALAAPLVPDIPLTPLHAALASVVLVVVSVCGDLVVSLMKRHRDLKDTSGLLPGHGGLLDRIDSVAAAAPVFALMVWASTS